VEEVKPAVAKIPKLTTFEITTALGFLAFAKQGVNAAVIEVGLGGRLDATNVVTPNVSVITSLRLQGRRLGLSNQAFPWSPRRKRKKRLKFWSV
jgi:folylpolyglutamate synthase/dihydropteroate synthase